MTLTRSSVEAPSFSGSSAGGSHTSSSDRSVTTGRLQLLMVSSWSDAGYPSPAAVSDTYGGFTWDELMAARFQLETFLSIQGYSRYLQVQLFGGLNTVSGVGRTTVDFGSVPTSHGSSGAGSQFSHSQIAGFLSLPEDGDWMGLVRQTVGPSTAEAPTVTFGGEDAFRLDLPGALLNSQSLTYMVWAVEHSNSAQSAAYAADGTKTVVTNGFSFPWSSQCILRNSTDIYGVTSDDSGDPGRWGAFAFEIPEEPAPDIVEGGIPVGETIYYDQLLAHEE